MEFKVGDKVKIKPWEQVKNHWGIDKTNWDKFIDIHTIKIVNGDYVIVINSSYVIPIEALIKVEEPTTIPTFKHKVGDIVQIKSLDWYNANKDKHGYIKPPYTCHQSFVEYMSEYCGKQYKIRGFDIGYRLEDLSGKNIDWNWQDWMFEDSIVGDKKIIEDPYPIDSIVEIDNIKYIVKDTPKKQDNCELCDCKDSSLYCRNTTLCYCSSDNRKDGKDIYLKKLPIEMDKYAIGSTFTSNGNTYMIVEKSEGGCLGCALKDNSGECHQDRPKDFYCIGYHRSDNKYVIAEKITPDKSETPQTTDKYPSGVLSHGEPGINYSSNPVSIITPVTKEVSTDLLTQLEIANSLIYEKPIKYREFGYGMTSPKESLIIKGLDKEFLLQIEEIPNTTVNKEIQLESVIIEYGIL